MAIAVILSAAAPSAADAQTTPLTQKSRQSQAHKAEADVWAKRREALDRSLNITINDLAPTLGQHTARSGGESYVNAAVAWMNDTLNWNAMTIEQVADMNKNLRDRAGNLPVEYIPLRYLLSEMPGVDTEGLINAARLMPVVELTPATVAKEYDMWCGCGQWVSREDIVRGVVQSFTIRSIRDGIVPGEDDAILEAVRYEAPQGAGMLFAAAFAFFAEAYLSGTSRPIDPDAQMYPSNHWQDLSGAPAWPPRRPSSG